eukprot:COSAG05_NODE_7699_length_778_cov_1.002946_1_plen_242_part_10
MSDEIGQLDESALRQRAKEAGIDTKTLKVSELAPMIASKKHIANATSKIKADSKLWMLCAEFCDTDLEHLLHSKDYSEQYSWKVMRRLTCQIVDGMAYLHSQKAIKTRGTDGEEIFEKVPQLHLDLKPENIMLANVGTFVHPRWVAKIADFGWDPNETNPEYWVGTLEYMAPEFAAARGDIKAGDEFSQSDDGESGAFGLDASRILHVRGVKGRNEEELKKIFAMPRILGSVYVVQSNLPCS